MWSELLEECVQQKLVLELRKCLDGSVSVDRTSVPSAMNPATYDQLAENLVSGATRLRSEIAEVAQDLKAGNTDNIEIKITEALNKVDPLVRKAAASQFILK
eukprot:g3443.t1